MAMTQRLLQTTSGGEGNLFWGEGVKHGRGSCGNGPVRVRGNGGETWQQEHLELSMVRHCCSEQ